MKLRFSRLLAAGLFLCLSASVQAIPIITGYDVDNAALSGFGGWAHSYSGTITPTGSGPDGSALADYSGGTGTMSDGSVGSGIDESQLFATNAFPSITLFLDDTYLIGGISLLNFPSGNLIPGNITALDVTIGGITQNFATSVLNTRDEFVDLTGTTLASMATDTLTLSNIFTTGSNAQYFAISEIELSGVAQSVSEPSVLALMAIGLAGLGVSRRNKV